MVRVRRRLLSSVLLLLLSAVAARAQADPLPSWNDGPSKQAIVEFVASVSKEGGPHFVPAPQRIATFDNDGTLWSEQPIHFQFAFALDRVKALALGPLALGAVTIMLVSFCSMMATARGFATKNGYQIDPNRDLMALGVCDLASGLTRGFVVSGADSRTAVADSAGGKTQMTSVVTSITIAAVLLFFTAHLAYLPSAALAAILISSSIGLFDLHSLRRYYRISKPEFRHSVVAMLGVMTIGVLGGVIVAVGLAMLKLLMLASKPHDAVLGETPAGDRFVNLATDSSAKSISGVVIYRFDASLLFFNADYFASRVRQVIHDAGATPSVFVLDAESISLLDTTGADVLETLRAELDHDGIQLRIARAKGLFRMMLERSGVAYKIGRERLFPSIRAATDFSKQGTQHAISNY